MNASVPSGALAIPTLPINAIAASPSNPRKRFDETYLQELANSIKEHGLIQPITVRPFTVDMLLAFNQRDHGRTDAADLPEYEIVVGECRWRAAKLAELTEIPAFWRELDDKQVLEIQVIENLQRRDVHPLEEADGYRQLIDRHGYTAEQIGEKIGKSRSYVYGRMKLSALASDGREIFLDGKIDASVALLIARIPAEKDQARAIKDLSNYAGSGQISFRDAKYRIQHGFTINLCHATFPLDDETLLPAAGSCSACLKRSGNSPELCPDIESADVCTDTRCYEEKRLGQREQLLSSYRERKIPVLIGEAAKEIASSGTTRSIDSEKWIQVDDQIEGDPENRTYFELLGDKTPITTVIEVRSNNGNALIELADATAMAKALKKAGWEPATEEAGEASGSENSSSSSRSTALAADRRMETEARERENKLKQDEEERRTSLLKSIRDRLSADDGTLNTDPIICALAVSHLRQEASYNGLDVKILAEFGISTPEEYDEAEELDKACTIMLSWPVTTALAYLIVSLTYDERSEIWNWQSRSIYPSIGLDAIANAVGVDIKANQEQSPAQTETVSTEPEAWPFPVTTAAEASTTAAVADKPTKKAKSASKAKGA